MYPLAMSRQIALTALALTIGCSFCTEQYKATYDIPNDFEGWVVVEYGLASEPALSVAEGRTIVHVSSSGEVRTSTPQVVGRIDYRYFAVADDGSRRELLYLGPDEQPEEQQVRDEPFVCCLHTGTRQDMGSPERMFEGFYVGVGPAGDAPDWR